MAEVISKGKYKGIYFMLISAFCFAVMGAITKVLGKDFSAIQLVFFRNLFGVLFIALSLYKKPIRQTGGKPVLLIFRGVIGTLALYAFFYNITSISLAEAVTYSQTSPIFIALLSYLLLKERLHSYAWLSIGIGFIGIVFIFRPDASVLGLKNNLIGLFCGLGTALAYLSISALKKHYDTRSVVLSFMVSGLVLPLFSMFLGKFIDPIAYDFIATQFVMPRWEHLPWILFLGLMALIGQIFLTKAYGEEKAGIVSSIGYSNIVFSILLGVLLGDRFPDTSSMIGICLIMAGGMLISLKK
jgi:drug/metabolite transporter (DMT)-like permease